ncbi:hypothetical protein U9M48_001145 [Paspalum notatum var. saurae]|uniref:Uncharacterized protein n=1 Tax=Paspalum notatum var. saurae TaxID=547442 RepID=A0AAQ3PNS7_PASNO
MAEGRSSRPSPRASLSAARQPSPFRPSSSLSAVEVVAIWLISKTCAPVAQATLRHSPKRQHKNKGTGTSGGL